MKPYARMLLMLVCVLSTALLLQGAFDASDHTKSERAVCNYHGGHPHTICERVEKIAPGGMWSSTITHSCRGIVRVAYTAPDRVYLFDYDVVEHRIHPANEVALSLLEVTPTAPAIDGGGENEKKG